MPDVAPWCLYGGDAVTARREEAERGLVGCTVGSLSLCGAWCADHATPHTHDSHPCCLPLFAMTFLAQGRFSCLESRGPHSDFSSNMYRLVASNLPFTTSWQDLKDWAREAGRVKYTDVWMEHGVKFGIIAYERPEDCDCAMRCLHYTELNGHLIKLEPESKRGRGRVRSRSRSSRRRRRRKRSYSRSSSRSASRGRNKAKRGRSRSRSRSRSPAKSKRAASDARSHSKKRSSSSLCVCRFRT